MPENVSLTPLELEILMHHYCCPGAFRSQSTVYSRAVEQFVDDGVFVRCVRTSERENEYEVTDLGKAWLSCILKTPKPKQVWVDATGTVIKVRQ